MERKKGASLIRWVRQTQKTGLRYPKPIYGVAGGARESTRMANTPASTQRKAFLGEQGMLEAVVERENMLRALKAVERNKGAAGIDRMKTSGLRSYLRKEWARIKEELLSGNYRPQPVRRVEIPKMGRRR